jgi:hypothetical protein
MLRDEFIVIESRMREDLAKARARFSQSGDKGTAIEDAFHQFLREYLPRRLEVGHGEVIDSFGNRSAQTDIVIANEDHPFTFNEAAPGLFLIEGVVGAGEVKAALTSDNLQASIRNSRVFRTLKLMTGKGTFVTANPSDLGRYYVSPPWFLFAYESQLGLSAICERLAQASNSGAAPITDLLDAVFVLGRGWVINFGDGNGALQFRNPEGATLTGWIWQNDECPLFQLMAWLSSVMPRMFRFEPILPRYMNVNYIAEDVATYQVLKDRETS